MKLRNLFEARAQSVGIIFGRFNPPHKGHRKAWEMASENDAWYVGTNQSTQGPKDPLPYGVKIEAMRMVYPDIEGHIMPEQSWLTMASRIYEKYGDILLRIYTDEEWVVKTIVQYNGKEGPHGFYNFKNIDPVGTPRLSSATELRNAVAADDRAAFSQAAGIDADTPLGKNSFFDVVKHYLTQQTAKPAKKEKAMKVKEYKGATDQERINAFKQQAKDMRDKGFVRAADDTEKVAKTIYKPKEKVKAKADEGRFGRDRDDQFSLGGRMPRTDRIDRDSSSGQDAQQRMERKMKQQTIDRLLDKGYKVDALNGKSLPELIQMLREGIPYSYGFVPGRKKPNATTRHLRDYPVSDKDVAKPVKKPEKKKPEQGVAEMDKSQPSHGRDGKISHSTYGSRDKKGSDYFKGKEAPGKAITAKQASKDALDILKKQGVAEGSLDTDNMVSHIGQIIQSIYPRGGDKNTYMKLVAQEMPRIVKANPKLFRRAFGIAYDKFFHIDQDDDDDFDYTDYSMRQGERGMEEEKQKGVAEVRGNIDADQAGFYVVDDDGNAVSGPFAFKQEAYERAAEMGRMYDVKYKGDVIPLDSLIRKIIKTLPPDVTSDDLQDPMDLEQQLEILRSPLLKVFSKLSPYEQAEVTDEVANHFYDRRFGDLDEGSKRCPQCGSTNCTCAPGKCNCKPVKGWLAKKEVDEAKETKVPQKPRQGPLRPQTGAGRHQDKKKDMKQGKEKHKKPLAEAIMDSMLSELDRPSGKLYIVIKGDPTGAVRMFGAFANSPEEVEFIAQRRGTKDKSGAKMKGLKVDLMFLDAADAMMDLRRIFKDIDFVGAEAAEFVFKNSAMNNDEVDPRVQEELKDFMEYVESGDDPRMAIYKEKEVGNEPDRVAKGVDHFVVGADGKRRRVPIPGKPNSQMGGHAVEQPDTYKYVLKQPNLANALRSMGFNFDGNKIIIPQDKRKMLQAKFAAKNIPWDSVFGAKEIFKESR